MYHRTNNDCVIYKSLRDDRMRDTTFPFDPTHVGHLTNFLVLPNGGLVISNGTGSLVARLFTLYQARLRISH